MIKTFKCKETEKIWNQQYSRKFHPSLQSTALRKLIMIHRAKELIDLKAPPSNHLEKLSGDKEGRYSIRINDQFRICFKWNESNALDVEIVDYH